MRVAARSNAKVLDKAKLEELKENALGVLSELRRNMIYRQPFCGSVSMSLDLVPTRDIRNPTACTDGKSIYFDIDFLSRLSQDEKEFVFCHEVWHNIMLHQVRKEDRNHELFNIATDLEVNQLLAKDGLTVPSHALTPKSLSLPPDLSAEEYYELLLKNKLANRFSGFNGNAGSSGQQGSQAECNASGNKDGKFEGQFDVHVYDGEKLPENSSAEDKEDKYGKVGLDQDFMPNPTKSAVEKIRETAISAAQQIERSRGTLPAHIQQIVGDLLEPEVPWQEVLARFVTRSFCGDVRVWSPPNRRQVYRKLYLQSRRGQNLKIAVAIDTSGSTISDIPKFLSEVNSLVESFGSYELHYIECDASVGKYELYDSSNPFVFDADNYAVTGGGGTMLMPIFEKLEYEQADIDCCIVFTDGYCEQFNENDAPPYPVLWIICKNGVNEFSNFGFGEVLKLKKHL